MSDGPGFKDHFSGLAAGYSAFRPGYPDSLFQVLAGLAPRRELAWDCACGSGQATAGLARHFDRVIATDASAQQIDAAEPIPAVEFRVAPAEASGLEAGSVDLVLVAQAAHWLDLPAFYREARRVGRPDAILALVSYGIFGTEAALDAVLHRFHTETLGPWWPPERAHAMSNYRDLPFPFRELEAPRIEMAVEWDLARLLGYMGTWSSVGRFRKERGEDPLEDLAAELAPLWGPPERVRTIHWPFGLRLARLSDYEA